MHTLWDPMLSDALAEMNQLWGRRGQGLRRVEGEKGTSLYPAVDIFEEETAFSLSFDLPGFKPEDVHVELDERVLKVSGERRREQESQDGYRRVERVYGSFERRFRLPQNVDVDALEAKLDAGVLTVRLPKREAPTARRIEIAAA